MPDGGWPPPPPDVHEFLERIGEQRRLALATRGMLVVDVQIPQGRERGWMRWLIGGPELADGGCTWYIDGSLVDASYQGTARTGFGIVLVGGDGEVRGCCLGAPPRWITNAAGAEGWALLEVLQSCPDAPNIITDCLGLLQQLQRGAADATDARRPLARLWGLIFAALDGSTPLGWIHRGFA